MAGLHILCCEDASTWLEHKYIIYKDRLTLGMTSFSNRHVKLTIPRFYLRSIAAILRVAIRQLTQGVSLQRSGSIHANFGRLDIRAAHFRSLLYIQLVSGCSAALMRARPVALSDLEQLIWLRGL